MGGRQPGSSNRSEVISMNRLDGRVALVTGAASGIGKATARRLAEEGAAVLLTDVNEAGVAVAAELREGGARAEFARHDVTSESDWEAAVARAAELFGGLDVLVNNAGMGDLATIEDTSSPTGSAPSRSTRPASSSA